MLEVLQQLPAISSVENSSKTTAECQSVIVDSTVKRKRQQIGFAPAVSKDSSSMSEPSIVTAESSPLTVSSVRNLNNALSCEKKIYLK